MNEVEEMDKMNQEMPENSVENIGTLNEKFDMLVQKWTSSFTTLEALKAKVENQVLDLMVDTSAFMVDKEE